MGPGLPGPTSGMAIDKDILRDDIDAIVEDWPSTIQWGQQTVSVTAAPAQISADVNPDMFLSKDRLEIMGNTADFESGILPSIRQIIGLKVSGESAYTKYCVVDKSYTDDVMFVFIVERVTDKTTGHGFV